MLKYNLFLYFVNSSSKFDTPLKLPSEFSSISENIYFYTVIMLLLVCGNPKWMEMVV